jgi:hypothetical protein
MAIMKRTLCSLLVFGFTYLSYSAGVGQELQIAPGPRQPGKITKVIELPDGTTETVVFGPSVESMARVLEMQLARGFGPAVQILDKLSADDVANLVEDELTESQSASLNELLTEYRREKTALSSEDADKLVALRLRCGRKLSEILLPEQIGKTQLSGFIFKVLTEKGVVPEYLNLEQRQKKEIISSCEKLNSEIVELVEEYEKRSEKLKERVTKTLIDSLDQDQRKKLERLTRVPLDEYFKNHSLQSLVEQTNLAFGD